MLVRALLGRPLIQASAADKLSGTAVKLIEQASKDADDARREASEARREASDARREAVEARRAADEAERSVRYFRAAILSPSATLEGLRAMVNEGPGNGVAAVSRDSR
jgi:hypothetical protein